LTFFWFFTYINLHVSSILSNRLLLSHTWYFHATWRHLQFFFLCLIDLLWISPCWICMVLLLMSNRLSLSHTWITSMQPGNVTFTCKFFPNLSSVCQIDFHRQLDLIMFKQNQYHVKLTQVHNRYSTTLQLAEHME
jgi:hypothetical protein